jgi:hypothetical protein
VAKSAGKLYLGATVRATGAHPADSESIASARRSVVLDWLAITAMRIAACETHVEARRPQYYPVREPGDGAHSQDQ